MKRERINFRNLPMEMVLQDIIRNSASFVAHELIKHLRENKASQIILDRELVVRMVEAIEKIEAVMNDRAKKSR